ncbi:MAG: nucleoside hydrolase [Cyclobacteriaceae bacterium]|nr:nucleoside hydrolase [Cyclobacteriaceae bacterium]
MKALTFSLFILCVYACTTPQSKEEKPSKVQLIFDTDFGPDYDDVGAIALVHAFADSGQVEVLATMASTDYDHVAATLNVFNTYFGRPYIPIGVPRDSAISDRDWQGWSDSVTAHYPHHITSNEQAEDAVALYRKILAEQPDSSVTIVTVGFLTNLANLLRTGPDQYSELSGPLLVEKKVKVLVSMAGAIPAGREFNVFKDGEAAKSTFDSWPTPVIFSGFEIGEKVKTGLPLIANENIKNSPVKDVFALSIPKADQDSLGRMSWDQTAVLVAIKGAKPYYHLTEGRMVVQEDGANTWKNDGKGHFYLTENWTSKQVEHLINQLMMHQPVKP